MFRPRCAPLLLPALALLSGLAAAPVVPGGAFGCACIALCLLLLGLPPSRVRLLGAAAAFFVLGAGRASRVEPHARVWEDGDRLHLVEWVRLDDPREPSLARILQSGGAGLVRLEPDPTLPPPRRGDWWLVRGAGAGPQVPGLPPRLRVVAGAAVALQPREWTPQDGLRDSVGRVLDRGATSVETRGVLRALVLGESRGIAPGVRERFSRSGTAHLLAISGLHVGLVCGAVVAGVRAALRRVGARSSSAWFLAGGPDKVALLPGVLVSGAYVLVAGAPVSARRAWSMLAAASAAWWCGRVPVGWNILGFALIVVAWTVPEAALGLGSGLSFTAVAGLLAAAPSIEEARGRSPRALRGPVGLLLVSGVATVVTAPLVAAVFGRVPLAGVWANVPAVPAFGVLLPLALAGAAVGCVTEPGGAVLVRLASSGLDFVLHWMGRLAPAGSEVLWQPRAIEVGAIYVGWSLLLWWGRRR